MAPRSKSKPKAAARVRTQHKTDGPTEELGSAIPAMQGFSQIPTTGYFAGDDLEQVPELQWPQSVRTYHAMRNDSQIAGLYQGSTLPIRQYDWMIDPNGARDEVVEGLARDMNLPILGADKDTVKGRSKGKFSWDQHLRHLLLSLLYGHMFFEQVGMIDDQDFWHLKKLAPRMPNTLSQVNISKDGGLDSIRQFNSDPSAPPIPVGRLVAYAWDQEGANWLGRSMLRPIYRNFLIKDVLMRIDPINHERAGGVPWVEAPEKASKGQLAALGRMATQWKVGSGSGGALPAGAKLHLERPGGPPVTDSIKLQNEEMARAWVMMFFQLGQTETGSRALAQTFVDFFQLAQGSIAGFARDVTNEHVVEDWVDWNYGEDEQAPLIMWGQNEDRDIGTDALCQLIDKGAVEVDDNLKAYLRDRYDLPESDPDSEVLPPAAPQTSPDDATAVPPVAARARRQRRARAASDAGVATSPISLPSRPLRREPYDHEITAAVDFAKLDTQWENGRDSLFDKVTKAQDAQIEELHGAIVEASGDLKALANLAVTPMHADVIHAELIDVAVKGADLAIVEAKRQGKTIAKPDKEEIAAKQLARAEAVDQILASGLSQSASTKALQLTGGGLDEAEVADAVKDYLGGLSGQFLKDRLGGAITQAQNAGRNAVFASEPPQNLYASELLDENTCEECTAIDGTDYDTIEEAEQDYPTGGYRDCLGGERCRGTVVAVYGEAPIAGEAKRVGRPIKAETAELVTVPNVEIVKAGIEYQLASGPTTFTPEDLADAVGALEDPAIHAPRLKLGHEGPLATATSDQPSVGIVKNVHLENEGTMVVGDYTGVPAWLAGILASAYPSRSIEGNFDVETTTGNNWRMVITHVSLLGVASPGCSTLEDIQALYSPEGPADLTVIEAKEETEMRGKRRRGVKASVSTEDVRKAFYSDIAVDERYWWWVAAQYQEPSVLIVEDGESNMYQVAYAINGDEVTFEDPVEVNIQYVDKDTGKVAAESEQEPDAVFASAAESRPPDRTNKEEEEGMTAEELRKSLGLAEDASDEEVRTKLKEINDAAPEADAEENDDEDDNDAEAGDGEETDETADKEQPAGAIATADDGTVRLDKDTYEALRSGAEAGKTARGEQVAANREALLKGAIKAGKFPKSRKDHYAKLHVADPKGTEDLIASLEAGVVPVSEQGDASDDTVQAGSTTAYDPSWLSPKEQARIAAAREGQSSGTVTLEKERTL